MSSTTARTRGRRRCSSASATSSRCARSAPAARARRGRATSAGAPPSGRWIAFTDDDCEPSRGWLEAALARRAPTPARSSRDRPRPIPRERGRLGPFSRTRSIEAPGPWFETCNIVYEAALLARLGGFDEAFAEALGEDTDLGWRALGIGAGHVWAESAAVHHAVDELGALGTVRAALRGSDSVLAFAAIPGCARRPCAGAWCATRACPGSALALAGVALARRAPRPALLALPYCADLALRCRHFGAGPLEAPVYVAADLAAAWTSLRGSLRHRRLVL